MLTTIERTMFAKLLEVRLAQRGSRACCATKCAFARLLSVHSVAVVTLDNPAGCASVIAASLGGDANFMPKRFSSKLHNTVKQEFRNLSNFLLPPGDGGDSFSHEPYGPLIN